MKYLRCWRFTLLAGTARLKTPLPILTRDNTSQSYILHTLTPFGCIAFSSAALVMRWLRAHIHTRRFWHEALMLGVKEQLREGPANIRYMRTSIFALALAGGALLLSETSHEFEVFAAHTA